jgi:hypothetical protein
MKSQIVRELLALIEARIASRPSPIEYEMAYQVRVAIDRLRSRSPKLKRWAEAPKDAAKRFYSCSMLWID